jgi:hypothetical protein
MPWKNKPLELYYRNNVDYYLFVDESGEHMLENFNPQRPYFTVSSVMIKKDDYKEIKTNIDAIKKKYWKDGLFSPKQNLVKKVCFVSRDIRKEQKAFSRYYLAQDKYESFIDDLSIFMSQQNYKIIASCIDKQKLVSQYTNPIEPYNLAMEFIVERFARFLHGRNATGLIMMESRGKKEDGKLHELFLDFYNDGTSFISNKVIQKTITGGFYFNGKWNKEKNSLDTFCGLELADLVAHPIGHYAQTKNKTRPFEIFEEKFLGFENYMGKGLKIFP